MSYFKACHRILTQKSKQKHINKGCFMQNTMRLMLVNVCYLPFVFLVVEMCPFLPFKLQSLPNSVKCM